MSSVRKSQLEESINVRRFLREESRMRRRIIDLHSTSLKRFVRKLKLEKFAILHKHKRRRFLRLNPKTRRRRRRMMMMNLYDDELTKILNPPPSNILQQTSYQYKEIDGYKYGILFQVRLDEEKGKDDVVCHDDIENKETLIMRYSVTLQFMYRLRNGLLIQQRSAPWDFPFAFRSIYEPDYKTKTITNNNCIPIGLAALITGLGIPDTCREAMFNDISRFAPPHPAATSNNVLCMEIQITTLQLEDEDVLGTQLRANVDRICRSQYIDVNILKNEANFQSLNMNIFEEVERVEDCCSICLEELLGYTAADLPCSHVYHYDCIFEWLSQYNFCPLCRHPYRRLLHPLQNHFHPTKD